MHRTLFKLSLVWLWASFLGGCESFGARVEPAAMATGTRAADAAGVVVLYLCDQARLSAARWSDTHTEYSTKAERIRTLCLPVANAYAKARATQLAALAAKRVVDKCQSRGAACATEVAALTVKAAEAIMAEKDAVGQAQQVLVRLQVVQ